MQKPLPVRFVPKGEQSPAARTDPPGEPGLPALLGRVATDARLQFIYYPLKEK